MPYQHPHLETVAWVPVKETLPPAGEDVITWLDGRMYLPARRSRDGRWLSYMALGFGVTAWVECLTPDYWATALKGPRS